MKKRCWLALVLMLVLMCAFTLVSCNETTPTPVPDDTIGETPEDTPEGTPAEAPEDTPSEEPHTHAFGDWVTLSEATCETAGVQVRVCACGEQETEESAALGHTEVVDAAVAGTCTTPSITEGKHCSVCGKVTDRKSVV